MTYEFLSYFEVYALILFTISALLFSTRSLFDSFFFGMRIRGFFLMLSMDKFRNALLSLFVVDSSIFFTSFRYFSWSFPGLYTGRELAIFSDISFFFLPSSLSFFSRSCCALVFFSGPFASLAVLFSRFFSGIFLFLFYRFILP